MSEGRIEALAANVALPAAPHPAAAGQSAIAVLGRRAVRVLVTRWWATALAVLGCAALAAVVAFRFTTYTWEVSSVVLFTPLPIPETHRSLYTPPTLQTQTALVKSPAILEQLLREFDLPIPAKVFDKLLKVEVQKSTETIILTFHWENGEEAAAMLNRLVELFIRQAAETRNQRLSANIADQEADLKECRRRLDAANEALRQFQIRERVLDAKGGVDRLQEEITGLEGALETAKRTRLNYDTQLRKLDAQLAELKAKEEKEADSDRQFEAAQETVADNRRRQDRLRELIEDERKQIELKPLLESKQREYQRILDLYNHRAATITQVERLQAEIGALVAKLQDNDRIKKWREEMEKIDQVVVPKSQKKSLGSPIIVQTLTRHLELDLQLTAVEEEIRHIQVTLEMRRKGIGDATARQQRATLLLREIEGIEVDRQRLEAQIATLRGLLGPNTREFAIVTPARKGADPYSSNRKTLLVAVLGAGLLFSLGLIVGHDLLFHNGTGEEVALRLPLPTLALLARKQVRELVERLPTVSDTARALALRVRQQVHAAGAAVLFTAPEGEQGLDTLVWRLAQALALRDERVLLVDARVCRGGCGTLQFLLDGEEGHGLADYLTFRRLDVSEVVHPTATPGVDYLPAGQPAPGGDVLATHRMRELMEQLRDTYTLLLLLGPPTTDAIDLEILAAHSAGVVLFLGHAGPRLRDVRGFLRSMTELNAPMLGTVVVTTPWPTTA